MWSLLCSQPLKHIQTAPEDRGEPSLHGQELLDILSVLKEREDAQVEAQQRGQVALLLHVPLKSLLAQQCLLISFFLDQEFMWELPLNPPWSTFSCSTAVQPRCLLMLAALCTTAVDTGAAVLQEGGEVPGEGPASGEVTRRFCN